MLAIGHQLYNYFHLLRNMLLLLLLLQLPLLANAHFIQIDNTAFRTSYFPQWPIESPSHGAEKIPRNLGMRKLSPAELMTDLTNDLAYRILHYHSILNRNNFAFSPTALMSVLIALYEGSAGRSALELHKVLMLPSSRDVIRIGYRDIHRRLRTYFFGSENPLKGLSLNKDNVTIAHNYETLLLFYGYDLGMDMISSTVSKPIPSTTVREITDETTMTATTSVPKIETTLSSPAESSIENVSQNQSAVTTIKPNTTTTPAIRTVLTDITTTATTVNTTFQSTTTDPETPVPDNITVEPEPLKITTDEITAEVNEDMTTSASAPATENSIDAAELVAASPIELNSTPFQRLQKSRPIQQPSAKLQAPLSTISKPKHIYLPQHTRSRSGRHKRNSIPFKGSESNLFVTLFSPHHQFQHNLYKAPISFEQLTKGHDVDTLDEGLLNVANTKTSYSYSTDVISHLFYLGNQQVVHTTFKVYNAVLYFKYFDDLKMSALELELDTPDYNLIILLPDSPTELASTTASLSLAPSLRLMRKQLKPRWVQAVIPDFKLHGIIFLTNDLQNMGVCDLFEPNRADFRPMTEEKGIYAKHIEQSINVNIRTHPINQLKRNYGSQTQPIQISVNHPFLFFVIDRDLDIAVMAGRILNPLNVRIQ
uniref:Serpin B8 n=1 Tax=Ceratitis capitata TaxID=7213 RepID=W8B683_CERCA